MENFQLNGKKETDGVDQNAEGPGVNEYKLKKYTVFEFVIWLYGLYLVIRNLDIFGTFAGFLFSLIGYLQVISSDVMTAGEKVSSAIFEHMVIDSVQKLLPGLAVIVCGVVFLYFPKMICNYILRNYSNE